MEDKQRTLTCTHYILYIQNISLKSLLTALTFLQIIPAFYYHKLLIFIIIIKLEDSGKKNNYIQKKSFVIFSELYNVIYHQRPSLYPKQML